MTGRSPFADYRARLSQLGFRPSRKRGQNFLLDPAAHRAIAAAADLGAEDLVLEIGVGLGFLTRELAALAGAVLGVEVDDRLLQIVRSELPDFPGGGRNVRLIEADALDGQGLGAPVTAALETAWGVLRGRFAVVSNLPYSIAGPLMGALMGLERLPDRVVVLVPRELAARWTAAPGGRAYGALSAVIQIAYRPAILRVVGREAFRPRPRVDSAVLSLTRLGGEVRGAAERRAFQRFLRALFGARRKQLATALPAACRAVQLPEIRPDPALQVLRPEALGPAQLWELYRRCSGS